MSTPGTVGEVQQQLYDRRQRLESASVQDGDASQIRDLLQQVDAALERVQRGTFGICETCHESIEPERLARDPLIRYCLDHLGPAERQILQADLDLASVIQRKLLPNREFNSAGWEAYYHYEPVGPVSGD